VLKLETDDRVRVVVFDSAVEGFFLTHYDFLAKPEESAKFPVDELVCRRYLTCSPG